MNVDAILIGAPRWVMPAAAIALLLIAAVAWNYLHARPRSGSGAWRSAAAVLKVLGIAILAVCLVEPLGRGERPRPQANLLPMLVDTSRSMTLRNSGRNDDAATRVVESLDAGNGWVQQVEQIFDVRRYAFDVRMRGVDTFSQLAFEGEASNLRTALETLADRFRGRPVAGLLLASDGNWTDADASVRWSELGFPVFPIRDHGPERLRDLRIADVTVSQTDFETAPVTIDASVEAVDLQKETVVVRLVDADGDMVDEQTITTGAGGSGTEGNGQGVRFRFRPKSAGVFFYRVECFLQRERKRYEQEAESRIEATVENNQRWVVVHQRRGPYGVLYVGGRPNWEFKFLRRAIDEDAEVRMLGLVRIAPKQPKFSFRDSDVGSTNPLFAGLGEDEEEAAEQLDEPVVLRLGVEDKDELVGGFPKDAESLFRYSAVILDDVEADFFTHDQLLLLRRFVSGRGGSVLMLGGQEALERGGYADTPLGELAPVYLPRTRASVPAADGPSGPYRMELTREGLLQPFLRLRETEATEAARLERLPPLSVLNSAERIKPGAVVLAVARTRSGDPQPALVTQPFGKGKTAAFLLGDLWRWSLRRESEVAPSEGNPENRDDPAQAWRQVVRWLVSDVAAAVETSAEESSSAGTIRIVTDVRDESFSPLDGAEVKLQIETPEDETVEVAAVADTDQAGRYTAEFWPRTEGGYRVRASATAPDGTEIGIAETGWATDAAGDEFKRLDAHVELLERIASESGGRIVGTDELDSFAHSLSSGSVPVTERWVFPLWHRPWILALAIVCLCGEWGIRRWKGLP